MAQIDRSDGPWLVLWPRGKDGGSKGKRERERGRGGAFGNEEVALMESFSLLWLEMKGG